MNWLSRLLERLFNLIPQVFLIDPDEAGVRITLGTRVKPTPPGWYLAWPVIQHCTKLTITPQVVDIRPQSVVTASGEAFCIGGAIKYRIRDAVAAILKVQDFDKTLIALSLGILNAYCSEHADFNRAEAAEYVLKGIKEAARGWGLDIQAFYITDVGPVNNIRLLMDKNPIELITGELR